MRVVSGAAGGLRLRGPGRVAIRPTTDKVREAIFNSLESMSAVDGAVVADLFAGTGACGIEALSRGAASATFVDSDEKSLRVVRSNLVATQLEGRLVRADVLSFLSQPHSFDLAFADPPYAFDAWEQVLARIDASIVVCESDRVIEPDVTAWSTVRSRRYGATIVTILEAR